MIILKNISDKKFQFSFTDHPITRPDEFAYMEDDYNLTEKGLTQVETLNKAMKKSPQIKDKLSKHYDLAIVPGETVKFGLKQKYSEEQAEYIYALFGGYAEMPNGQEVLQPIIEVDEEGNEKRDNLYLKHRMKKGLNVGVQPGVASHQQFQIPEKK